jgi:hypothetical protein
MNLKLSVKDRAVLPSILPEKSSYLEQRMIKDITKLIEFTEEEEKEYAIRVLPQGQIGWNAEGSKEENAKEFKFSKEQFDLIKQSARKLDEDGKVNQLNVGICEKVLD